MSLGSLIKFVVGKDNYEKLFVMTKYHKLNRPHFIWTIPGIIKYFEVTPIVLLCAGALTVEAIYFTTYYPMTRGEVLYTRTPLYTTIDLENPPQWKLFDFTDYRTYKPLIEQKRLLKEMACEEWYRLKEYEEKGIDTGYSMDQPDNCEKSPCNQ